MSYFTFGGHSFRVSSVQRLKDEVGGERERTVSGYLAGDPDWVARRWSLGVRPRSDTEANLLYSLCRDVVPHQVSGVPFGDGSFPARVEVNGDDYRWLPGGHKRVITLEVREVNAS